MLPEFPPNIRRLPARLDLVRVLEEYDGALLSEYRSDRGETYVEKWCARDGSTTRTLVVRSGPEDVSDYLAGRMTMLGLLGVASDGEGYVVDRTGDQTVAVYAVRVMDLPDRYLPRPTAFHDETLRPEMEQ